MSGSSPARSRLAIAATFTAEPVEESLRFWIERLSLDAEIRFAGYGQLLQELLDPHSLLSANSRGLNVLLLRLEDWIQEASPLPAEERLRRGVEDLVAALRPAAGRGAVPFLLAVCPSPGAVLSDPGWPRLREALEQRLHAELSGLANLRVVPSAELANACPAEEREDRVAERVAHIPYTRLFYATLGTRIARELAAHSRPPYKVIAVDCDQTLWKGVCAEDGAGGVEIDAPRRVLQSFLVRQQESGLLLCVCSKNNARDVAEVFETHRDMPLRAEHIVSWRVDWRPKSENLRSLAEELGLGLDSFVLLDDNPVECAEVAAGCPEVLTLTLPAQAEEIPRFLENVWAFDRVSVTEEDGRRTALYREETRRGQFEKASASFAEFLARLHLEVRVETLVPSQHSRASQLTARTNQFNITTVRRTEAELAVLSSQGWELVSVHVRDRFGDYGLVGLLVYRAGAHALELDTFLLSCRVLGRGVEHRVLARLGEIARERERPRVDIPFVPTRRNGPALGFLESLGVAAEGPVGEEGRRVFRIPADAAAGLTFRPEAGRVPVPSRQERPSAEEATERPPAPRAPFQTIASELADPRRLLGEIETRFRRARPALSVPFEAPRRPAENLLAAIWSNVLGVERVGLLDNFFDLGGHSLSAVNITFRIREAFHVELPLEAFLLSPTIAGLAEKVEAGILEQARDEELDGLLDEIEGLSDEDARSLAREARSPARGSGN